MITISPCQLEDCATVAAIWNARRLDPDSCWYAAEEADEAYIAQLLAAAFSIEIAYQDAVPMGFGLWTAVGTQAWLVALAAEEPEVYYRLMAAYCQWGQTSQRDYGYAELSTAATSERARMDALGVIEYTAIGFDPLPPGAPPESRVPRLLRATCDLTTLAAAIDQMLGETT